MKENEAEISRALVEQIGMPMRYMTMDLNKELGTPEVVRTITKYCRRIIAAHEKGIGVVLTGAPLSGQTFWLSYLLRYAVLRFGDGATYKYRTLRDLTTQTFAQDDEAAKADFLAVDDIDGSSNAGMVGVFKDIVRERRKRAATTFFATHLSDADGKLHYGPENWRNMLLGNIVIHCPGLGDKVTSLTAETLRKFMSEE